MVEQNTSNIPILVRI